MQPGRRLRAALAPWYPCHHPPHFLPAPGPHLVRTAGDGQQRVHTCQQVGVQAGQLSLAGGGAVVLDLYGTRTTWCSTGSAVFSWEPEYP